MLTRHRNPARDVGPLTLLTGVLVLALVATLTVRYLQGRAASCGDRGERLGGECITVTDGSYVFNGRLRGVLGRIAAENRSVAGQEHATIALMIPMDAATAAGREQILHEVQGAYLAQHQANREGSPHIRLVLANPGRDRTHWRPVADRLAGMTAAPDNLRAVFGFDRSVPQTADALDYLTNVKHLPAVGGPLTADTLANPETGARRFDGFARVVPTNTEQADALVHFDHGRDPRRAVLVEDERPHDAYVSALRTAFARKLAGSPHAPQPFTSEGIDAPSGLDRDFADLVVTLCVATPPIDTVYFAGRPLHLRQFVNALATERTCAQDSFTVISGSDAATLYLDTALDRKDMRPDKVSGRGGITVEYTAISHPDAWTTPHAPATGGTPAVMRGLTRLVRQAGAARSIGPVDLADSRTVAVYDSARTAIQGIRVHTHGTHLPSLSRVAHGWPRLQGPYTVEGAGGWICLDAAGNPYDKAVAVVRLDPATANPRFLGLAWPEGEPPADLRQGRGCVVPQRR
ncbi:hypothetical protein ACFV3R_06005 [Streptomyces sp. NPDC059740]|uniref:hypothetical protein n=1 Tax=Streptomyces sp. NPDC059740 TaxID=3346926 RepID=UPI003655D9AF